MRSILGFLTPARLGGDEFALLLDDIASGDEALAVGERVVRAVATPFAAVAQCRQLS